MKKYSIIIGLVVLVGVVVLLGTDLFRGKTQNEKACTLEAKVCSDGSTVGRTGPNCEFAPCPDTSASTGVRGTVSLGPTCPVERIPPDPQCTDKPYATSISVFAIGSPVPLLIGSSNTSGTFQFLLPEGKYTLIAGGSKPLPRCSSENITVVSGGYVTANIFCDTGIR